MIRQIRNFFFRDWLLKLFSLTLAVLTWLAVKFSIQQRVVPVPGAVSVVEKTYFDLPVTILSHTRDVSGFKAQPAEVDVTVQGTEDALRRLPRNNVRVIVDLSDVVLNSTQELPVEVIAPSGITHVRVKPENLVQIIPPPTPKPESKPE
jgi:YbbR domain-containing protein